MRHVVFISFLAISLSACGSEKLDLQNNANIHEAMDAATGPLQDANIRRTEIPPLLIAAAKNPYAHPARVTCDGIKTEIEQLTELLGPDLTSDATFASTDGDLADHIEKVPDIQMPDTETVVETAGDMAHEAIMNVIHSETSILPFRSIIRRLTGADEHQKKLASAYEAGKVRRAYLKGMAEDHFGPQCLAKPIMVQATPAAIVAKADVAATIH